MKRRDFVGFAGTAAAGVLSAGLPRLAAASAPSAADWRALGEGMSGGLIRPGDASYPRARLVYNSLYDGVRPQAVARCRTDEDVREAIGFARRFGLPLAARSGGHSYLGYSTTPGIVVDLAPMDEVESAGERATVGGGARLIDVYEHLISNGVCIPGGTCPSVGIGGLTLGGGIGVLSRAHGLTADCLASARMVAADGRIVECDAEREGDLFWALRGGGGGNFGIVTSFTFRTHRTQTVQRFLLSWEPEAAADVVSGWMVWARDVPESVWTGLVLSVGPPEAGGLSTRLTGVCLDSEAERHADRLVAAVGREPSSRSGDALDYRALMMAMAGCQERSFAECHLEEPGTEGALDRSTYVAASDLFDRALPRDGAEALVAGARAPERSGVIILDALGGAVARIEPAATAFVHRRALFSAQYFTSRRSGTPRAEIEATAAWQPKLRRAMKPWSTGHAYQNYLDPNLRDWRRAYYGDNDDRLARVQAAWDPEGVFRFPHGIAPPA